MFKDQLHNGMRMLSPRGWGAGHRAGLMAGLLLFVMVQTASARDEVTNKNNTAASVQELEAFRAKLISFFTDLEAAHCYMAEDAPPNLLGDIQAVQQQVPEYTLEELAKLQEVLAAHPTFWDIPASISSALGPKQA